MKTLLLSFLGREHETLLPGMAMSKAHLIEKRCIPTKRCIPAKATLEMHLFIRVFSGHSRSTSKTSDSSLGKGQGVNTSHTDRVP